MPARKQYSLDIEKAKLNKEKIKSRSGKKWKQLELLEKLKNQEEVEGAMYGALISQYQYIKDHAFDEEINKLASNGIKNTSERCRKALRKRFSMEVQWGIPDRFTQAEIMRDRIPMNTVTYRELKEDIRRKSIVDPILVTDSYEIIDGFNRWKIACELKLDKIPYMMVNIKTLPENLQQRMIFDLGLGNNLQRRQLTMEQKKGLIKQWLMFHKKSPMPGRPTGEEVELSRELKEKGLEGMEEIHRHIANSFGLAPLTQKDLAGHMGVSQKTVEREAGKINRQMTESINPVNSEPILETHVFSNTYGKSYDRDKNFPNEVKEWIELFIEQKEIKNKDNLRLDIKCVLLRG